MPTIIQTTQGTVTGLWGSAIVKGADGHAHPLKLGDIVKRGDVILTSQDGIVELTSDVHAAPVAASAATDVLTGAVPAEAPPKAAARNEVDQVIEKLAQNDTDAATAAGLAGGDGGEFLPGLRVDRITESLTALGLNNNQQTDATDVPPVDAAAASAAALANIAPSALDGAVSGLENTTLPVALRGVDSDGNVVSVTVTNIPTGGTLLLADGITLVSAGQTLTPAQAAGLLFKPAVDFVGQAAITFFVTDNQGSTSNGATVSLNVVDTNPPANQPPVAVNDTATTAEDTPATGNVLSNDSDPDGNALTVIQFSLGSVTYAAGDTAVLAGIGRLTLAANGAYTFTPEPNYNGPVPVATYTVSDGIASVTATLTLSVSAVNDAPVAQNDLASTPVNAPTTIAVLANDSDVDGDTLTVTSASVDPALGTVTVNPNGTLAFNPANNLSGPVVIQYTISDGQGGTANATVAVNIGPNTPPEGTDTTVTVTEDGTRSFSAADFGFSDADAGQSFANLRIDVLPAAGSLTLSGTAVVAGQVIAVADLGNLVFTPAPNANGSGYASFSFSVQDSAGAFDTAPNQITIDVGAVNDPPVAVDDLASTPINTSTTIAVLGNDSDADGNALTVTAASVDPTRGTVTINPDGTLAFTPAGNVSGPVLVSYTISDGQGGFASATVTVNVGPNTPPTGTDAVVVIAEDGSRSFSAPDFGFSDADAGQSFANVRIDALPTVGTLTLSGVAVAAGQVIPVAELGNLVYAPAPNANGSGYASFSFSVQDSGGAFDTAPNQITIDVTPVADAAVIGGVASGATVEDTTLTTGGTLTITDPDAGEAAFNPLSNVAGAHGTFSIDAAGVWRYTLNNADPAVQALGAGQTLPNESFTVTSIDGTSQIVTVTISGTNDAPVAQASSFSVAEDAPLVSGSVVATDVDANAVLSYSLNAAAPPGLSFNPNGSYTFDASNTAYQSLGVGQSAVLTVPYTVTDDQGATSVANLVITITGTNDAAVIAGVATGSVTEDGTPIASGTLTVSDVDSPVGFVATTATGTYGNFSVDAAGGWIYTLRNADTNVQALTSAQHPIESFTVTSIDGTTSTVTITVNGANEPPVAVATPASGNEDVPGIPVQLGGTDVDGNIADFTIGSLPTNGMLLFGGAPVAIGQNIPAIGGAATLSFVPAANFNGSTAFDFTATDNEGAVSPSVQVPITVIAVADPAVIGGVASGATVEDTTLTTGGTLTITDPDAGEAAFNPLSNVAGAHGTFSIDAAGVWSYTLNKADPAVQALGTGQTLPNESFTVTSIDGTSQIVTVTIAGTNDAPVAQASSFSVAEDAPLVSGSVVATDVDANASLSYSLNAAPPPGLTFNTNGSYAFDASNAAYQSLGAGQQQVLTIPYTVTDDQGATSIANLVITVIGTNDAPIALNDSASTPINTPLASINVLGNDSDIDGGTLSITTASLVNPALGSISVNPNGTLAFTPASNVSGPVVVNYTVSDGQGGFANATVTINVGANTPPAGSDATVTVAEDGSRNFSAADFGYSDADAGQGFAQVRIDALPAAGTLTLNGAAVSAGQTIAVANLGNLVYTPAPNANGSAYAGFDFSVQDSAGAFDATPSRLTITVSAVNDAPVAMGTATLAAINEDDPNPAGASVGSLFAARFSDATDQVSGGSSANTFAGIAISNHAIDASKGAWQYSTDGGVNWTALPVGSTASAVTLAGSDWLRFVPAANYNGAATPLAAHLIESGGAAIVGGATVDLSAGTGGTTVYSAATVALNETINPVNDPPVARNDEGIVTAAQTLTVTAAEGVIQSTSTPSGRDTDVEGDALTVSRVSAGAGAPSILVPAGGVTIAGTYGDLLLRNDGSYTYTASRADAVATGTRVDDVFTYQVSDGHGGLATASLTLHVGGVADTLNAAPPTTTALTATLGLNGEYYGYNDFNPGPTSPNRRHADDGVYGNLDRAADVTSIVNGRNAAFTAPGTPGIVGSSTAAAADAADARFTVRAIDYGTSPTVTGTLGTNPNIAAGGSTAGLTNDNSQLFKFLNRSGGGDASTISVRQGTGDNDQIGGGPTSGLGRTSDAAMRLTGEAYLAAGLYDIRVYADDGFRLRLDNQTVAAFDDIQSPTTRVYTGVPIDGGLTPLELLYWEQGGNAVLRVEFKLSGTPDSAYQVLGSQNLPLFSDANAPVLSDLQDLVAGPTPGSYLVRTGSLLDGGNGDDILNGSAGRDILIGGQGKDTLNGGAGDDLIRGGAGHDQLTGGAGHDVFRWSLGDAGTTGAPARDVITDFDNTPHGGDVLDLRDLLVGESHAANTVALPTSIGLNNALTITPHEGNLANYLHFSAVGGNTVVEISSTGGFASSYTPAAVDQVITLTGLNLVGGFTNDHQVINDLLQRGKLVTD
jgi:VCBS repeat-containing protein